MATMAERLIQAWHSHDARRVAALFAEDYLSDQPAHPGRAFTGNEQVLANWTEVFEGVPDFSAELLASSVAGEAEWIWTGRHADGSAFAMRGVTVLVIRDGLIAEGRPYMESFAMCAVEQRRRDTYVSVE